MRFRTTLELHGKTATGMVVPPEVVEALGGGKKPAVTVTIGEFSYRSTIAVMGGRNLLPLSAERRAAAGVQPGDELDVDVELDTTPRTVDVPPELAAALEGANARPAFDALSYSKQLAHALAVSGAKTDTTRDKRLASIVGELTGR